MELWGNKNHFTNRLVELRRLSYVSSEKYEKKNNYSENNSSSFYFSFFWPKMHLSGKNSAGQHQNPRSRPHLTKMFKMCQNIIFLWYKVKKYVWTCFSIVLDHPTGFPGNAGWRYAFFSSSHIRKYWYMFFSSTCHMSVGRKKSLCAEKKLLWKYIFENFGQNSDRLPKKFHDGFFDVFFGVWWYLRLYRVIKYDFQFFWLGVWF